MHSSALDNSDGSSSEPAPLHADAHAAAAAAAGKRIVSDYFMRRDLRVRLPLIQDILRRHPGIAEAVLPDLVALMGSARTVFLQAQALTLLATILRLPQVIHPQYGWSSQQCLTCLLSIH